VLRAEVQVSESREALVLAREGQFEAVARLNNTMGRNSGLPLEVIDWEPELAWPGALAYYLETAAIERPEVRLAQHAVAAAQEGRQVAQAGFLPRVYARGLAGYVGADNILSGAQEGAGLHLESPLYC
jgi:outer membrane protein TolC